jgi:hypothetical protein
MGRQQIRKLRITEWEPNRKVAYESTTEQGTTQGR